MNKCKINSFRGKKHSLATKKHLSDIRKGKRWAPDWVFATLSARMKGNKHHLGHKHSEESKKKMSDAHSGCIPWNKGKKLSLITRQKMSQNRFGAKNGFYGKKHSIEVLKVLSEKAKLKVGNLNPRWIDGRSYIPYPYTFRKIRKLIIERDNFICQLCNDEIKQQTLQKFITVHHIDYNKNNNSSENLITLCNFCNISVNNNRNDWLIFFQNKINNLLASVK